MRNKLSKKMRIVGEKRNGYPFQVRRITITLLNLGKIRVICLFTIQVTNLLNLSLRVDMQTSSMDMSVMSRPRHFYVVLQSHFSNLHPHYLSK